MQYMYRQHYLGLGRAARGWSASNLPSRTLPRPAPCIKTRERAQDGARLTTSASARGRATAAAPFAGRTADQVSGFLRDGFTTIKASRVRGDGLEELAATVGAEAAAVLTSKEDTWRYALWRVFNSVQDNQKRHSLALPMSPSLRRILNAAVGLAAPVLDQIGMPKSSLLVELSAILSQPGSQEQSVHADTSHVNVSCDATIVSIFVALSQVTLEAGPTHVLPGTHSVGFHEEVHRLQSSMLGSEYSSDGQQDTAQQQAVAERAYRLAALLGEHPSQHGLLDVGDILLFDTKVFHYGGANSSQASRDLLCFSFQQPPNDQQGAACPPRVEGFTYHIADDVEGTYALGDFAPE